jgi:C-1 hydroxylase
MSTEENKAIVHKLIDAWNRGDVAGLMAYWSPDMVHHSRHGKLAATTVGTEVSRFLAAFPDLHIDVHSIVAEDDLVNTRLTMNATHKGAYMGFPATGKKVSCSLMGQLKIVDGTVVEHWAVADALHLLQQLGLIPADLLAATA